MEIVKRLKRELVYKGTVIDMYKEMVLLQNGHPLFLGDDDLAGGGLQIPGEDAEEGGLAGAVGADDAVAVAGNELQLHVLEQGLAAEVHAYIVDCDHVGILSSRSPRFSRRLLLLSVIAGQRSGRQTVPRRRIKKRRPNGRHRTLCCPKLVLLCCFFSLLSSILLHLYRNILTVSFSCRSPGVFSLKAP